MNDLYNEFYSVINFNDYVDYKDTDFEKFYDSFYYFVNDNVFYLDERKMNPAKRIKTYIEMEKHNFDELQLKLFNMGKMEAIIDITNKYIDKKMDEFIDDLILSDDELMMLIKAIGDNPLITHKKLCFLVDKKPNALSNYFTRHTLWKDYIYNEKSLDKKSSVMYFLTPKGERVFGEIKENRIDSILNGWNTVCLGGNKNGEEIKFRFAKAIWQK